MDEQPELPMQGEAGKDKEPTQHPLLSPPRGGDDVIVSESEQARRPMNPAALVFLDDPVARRLVVAWETCGGDPDTKKWLAAAGYGVNRDVERVAHALKLNRICRPNGVVDPAAMQYVRTHVAQKLKLRRAANDKP